MEHSGEASLFQDLFLRSAEKDKLAQWSQPAADRSFVNWALSPLVASLSRFVPDGVAPSLLTLCGTAAVVQAWYYSASCADCPSLLAHGAAILSIFLFWALGALDVLIAEKTAGDHPVAELFRYACGLVATPFIVSMSCALAFQRVCPEVQWYLVQTVMLVLLLKHYGAFKREVALCHFIVGPGDVFAGVIGLLAVSAVCGQGTVVSLFGSAVRATAGSLAVYKAVVPFGFDASSADGITAIAAARAACVTVFALTLAVLACSRRSRPHGWTRCGLAAALVLRVFAAWIRFAASGRVASTPNDAMFDGLYLAMLTTDLVVAKMAGRGMHTWMVPMALMVLLPQWQSLAAVFAAFYFVAMFSDLVMHTNLPLFQVVKNVYCDGIYDLNHMGHKAAFQKALKHGNRLFVGVVGDKDANAYKRPPIMSAAEREREVSKCKGVTKVIQNAPCFGLTEEFIEKHKIHVVCYGREYLERFPTPDEDPYYKVPRKMGIAVPLDRYDDLSTSELIQRVLARGSDSKKSPT